MINKGEYTDLEYIFKTGDGDIQFVRDMVETFINDTPVVLDKMMSYAGSGNWKNVADLAHKLKTSLMFMGINSLYDIIRKVEFSGRNLQNTENITEWVMTINTTCTSAITELKKNLELLV